jgi:uncharacterized Zn-binding protein involved in type VI secretion
MSTYQASRVQVDTAGGLINTNGQSHVRIVGKFWAIVGDAVAGHGTAPHDVATMTQGSNFVKIGGVAACRAGNAASGGHTATGSGPVKVSS